MTMRRALQVLAALRLALATAQPSEAAPLVAASTRQLQTGTITGYAFDDADGDGVLGASERGVPDVSVYLFTCADMIRKTAKTNKKGAYIMEGIGAGQYYMLASSVPDPYEFGDVWDGLVDPATGRTACFDVAEGATVNVSFALVQPGAPATPPAEIPPLVSNAPTAKPTNPMVPAIPVTADPTKVPTTRPSTFAPATPRPTMANPTKAPTPPPSMPPTARPTDAPITAEPTKMPVSRPSTSAPVSSFESPTVSPTTPQSNNLQEVPSATEQYRMALYGIDRLEDEEAWARLTAEYIVDYFTSIEPGVVFNLTVDVAVQQQQSSGNEQPIASTGTRRRKLQWDEEEKYVLVDYNQTSSYSTADPTRYNRYYVAARPFETGSEGYIAALANLSPYYDAVESIGPIQIVYAADGSGSAQSTIPGEGSEESGGTNAGAIAAGVVCGLIVVVAILAIVYLERRRRKGDTEYMQPVGNGPLSSMGQRRSLDVEPSSSQNVFDDAAFDNLPGPPEHSASYLSTGSEIVVGILAPPGKLGVILDTRPEGGPAYVTTIKETCPIADQIFLGDKVIAVDGEDVQKVSAKKVCQMLAQRCDNEEREITVLREAGDP
ncbi:hypothetical protein ACHAXT_007365 [Thalassiosira profunda]